jgi:hypothetical protein
MLVIPWNAKNAETFAAKASRDDDLVRVPIWYQAPPKLGAQVCFKNSPEYILALGVVEDLRPGAILVRVTRYYV